MYVWYGGRGGGLEGADTHTHINIYIHAFAHCYSLGNRKVKAVRTLQGGEDP